MHLEPINVSLVRPELAERVAIPAYDNMTGRERAELAEQEPLSFLHAIGIGPSPISAALEGLARVRSAFDQPRLRAFVYRLQQGLSLQTGVVCGIPFDQLGLVKPHESTSPARVDALVEYTEQVGVVSSPVAVAYRHTEAMEALLAVTTASIPSHDFLSQDGLRQTVWEITGEAVAIAGVSIDAVYITDGHHRVASLKAYAQRNGTTPALLSVLFAHDDLRVAAFNRILLRVDPSDVRRALDGLGAEPTQIERPAPGETIVLFERERWLVRLPPAALDSPAARLDSARLDEHVIVPLVGSAVPGGNIVAVPGPVSIEEEQVAAGGGAAFLLADPSIDQMMAVADAGENMPAKSTYFSPKPRSGVFLRDFG